MSNKKILFSFFLIFTSTIVIGQNCARMPFGNFNSSSSVEQASIDPDAFGVSNPYALLTGEQLLKSMTQLTETPPVDKSAGGAIGAEYRLREGSFAVGNDLRLTTGPMSIGITSLAGEVCFATLERERQTGAVKKVFLTTDFTKPSSQISIDNFKSTVRSLALKFWSREETIDEMNALLDAKSEFQTPLTTTEATSVDSTRKLMLTVCTGMLSSFDTFSF